MRYIEPMHTMLFVPAFWCKLQSPQTTLSANDSPNTSERYLQNKMRHTLGVPCCTSVYGFFFSSVPSPNYGSVTRDGLRSTTYTCAHVGLFASQVYNFMISRNNSNDYKKVIPVLRWDWQAKDGETHNLSTPAQHTASSMHCGFENGWLWKNKNASPQSDERAHHSLCS